jgi:hypothetical protein
MRDEILSFLSQKDNLYLGSDKEIEIKEAGLFLEDDLNLYYIEEIAIEQKASRKEAIENILSSIKIGGINFIYLIIGHTDAVHFYFGIARDLYYDKEMELELEEIGDSILKPSIEKSLIGSKVSKLISDEKQKLFETINGMECFSVLEGVQGLNEETDKYMDRLFNIMNGDEYGILTISTPLDIKDIWNVENNLMNLYTSFSFLAISDVQESVSKSSTTSIATSRREEFTNVVSNSLYFENSRSEQKGSDTSANVSETNDRSETIQRSNKNNSANRSIATSNSNQEGTTIGESWNKTTMRSVTINPGFARGNATDSSVTEARDTTEGTSTSTSIVTTNKEVQEWMAYMDEILFPRLDYGKGKGMFNTSTLLFTDKKATLIKLENLSKLLLGGKTGNKIPIRAFDLNKDNAKIDIYKKFQLPHCNFPEGKGINNPLARSAISQYLDDQGNLLFGNMISTKELSSIITFPQNEVKGLNFIKPRQFVINIPDNIKEEEINYLKKILERLLGKGDVN